MLNVGKSMLETHASGKLPEALGYAICCLLDGPADKALEGIKCVKLSAPDRAESVCIGSWLPAFY